MKKTFLLDYYTIAIIRRARKGKKSKKALSSTHLDSLAHLTHPTRTVHRRIQSWRDVRCGRKSPETNKTHYENTNVECLVVFLM